MTTQGPPPPSPQPVIIIGMGPGGLSAAIEAARKGLPVVIVENREYFSRGQRLHGDNATFQFLDSLRDKTNQNNPDDVKFFQEQCFLHKQTIQSSDADGNDIETIHMDGVVQVKDVQAYLEKKLREFPNVEIRKGKGNELVSIDSDNQSVTLKKPDGSTQQIQCSHIIAADGARSTAVVKLNESIADDAQKIHRDNLNLQPRQKEVGTAAIQLKEGVPIRELPQEGSGNNFGTQHLKRLNELGWDKPYFPKVRVFRNEENTKFFFSGEVPKAIQYMNSREDKEAQRQALEEWGKFIVSVEMGLDPNDLELPNKAKETIRGPAGADIPNDPAKLERQQEKDRLRATAFALELSSSDKSAVELGNSGAFVLVGDAYKSANFFYGHGLNDAVQDGIKAVRCMGDTQTFDFEQYQKHQDRNVRMLNTRMRMEAEGPKNDLEGIFKRMNESMEDITKIASKMNDPDVKEALKGIERQAPPGHKDFDGQLYHLHLQTLSNAMSKFTEQKMAEPPSRRNAMKFLNSDASKYAKLQSKITPMVEAANKEIKNYFKTNNEQRATWAKQLEDTANRRTRVSDR